MDRALEKTISQLGEIGKLAQKDNTSSATNLNDIGRPLKENNQNKNNQNTPPSSSHTPFASFHNNPNQNKT